MTFTDRKEFTFSLLILLILANMGSIQANGKNTDNFVNNSAMLELENIEQLNYTNNQLLDDISWEYSSRSQFEYDVLRNPEKLFDRFGYRDFSYLSKKHSSDQFSNQLNTVTSDTPLQINSDDDFITHNFTGDGTKDAPYIIKDLIINSTGIYAINIKNTSKHFVIQNCSLFGAWYGISLENVDNGTATIKNNILSDNLRGIILSRSSATTILNNTISENNCGIEINNSNFTIVSDNKIYENDYGIAAIASIFVLIEQNRFNDNKNSGIVFSSKSYSTMRNNILVNNGIFFYEKEISTFSKYNITNNTVNSKQLGFYVNTNGLDLTTPIYGQLFLINSSNSMIENQKLNQANIGLMIRWSKNIEVSNNSIEDNNYMGMHLDHCSSITIENNTLLRNLFAMRISFSNELAINRNSLFDNILHGIDIYDVIGSTITNNILSNYFVSFYSWYCDDSIIENNTIYNSTINICVRDASNSKVVLNTIEYGRYGIELYNLSYALIEYNIINNNHYGMSVTLNSYSSISHNLVLNNDNSVGIGLSSFCMVYNNTIIKGTGISLHSSTNFTFKYNTITECEHGLTFWNSFDTLISYNNISHNHLYGIELQSNCNINITLNSFIDNNKGKTSQAFDSGKDLESTNLFIYNFWSDHQKADHNNDGIIDQPYGITGIANNQDTKPLKSNPLLLDNEAPIIHEIHIKPSTPIEISEIQIYAEVTDNLAVKQVTLSFIVNEDEKQEFAMSTNGTIFWYSFGPYSKGSTIEFTITAEDVHGNSVTSEVYSFIIEKAKMVEISFYIVFFSLFTLFLIRKRKDKLR